MGSTGETLLVPGGNGRSKVGSISREAKWAERREGGGGARSSDDGRESINLWERRGSTGTQSFEAGEAGRHDKGFYQSAGTEAKDLHQGEGRQAVALLGAAEAPRRWVEAVE